MRTRARVRRAAGAGCRSVAVGMLLAVVTMLTGSTLSVGVALVVGSLLVLRVGGPRR